MATVLVKIDLDFGKIGLERVVQYNKIVFIFLDVSENDLFLIELVMEFGKFLFKIIDFWMQGDFSFDEDVHQVFHQHRAKTVFLGLFHDLIESVIHRVRVMIGGLIKTLLYF